MKKLISVILIVVSLFTLACPAFAAVPEEITPLYNNVVSASCGLTISSSGNATVTLNYKGINGVTTSATVETYIQKKTLGLVWTTVNIGQPNNKWVDTVTGVSPTIRHYAQLDSTGTYRAVAKFTISGTGGTADVISKTSTYTYE